MARCSASGVFRQRGADGPLAPLTTSSLHKDVRQGAVRHARGRCHEAKRQVGGAAATHFKPRRAQRADRASEQDSAISGRLRWQQSARTLEEQAGSPSRLSLLAAVLRCRMIATFAYVNKVSAFQMNAHLLSSLYLPRPVLRGRPPLLRCRAPEAGQGSPAPLQSDGPTGARAFGHPSGSPHAGLVVVRDGVVLKPE